MEMNFKNVISENKLDLDLLKVLTQKPVIFESSEELFWDDPHISKSMLEAHLNPDIDAASRKPETIEKTVKNLISSLNLKPGSRILDLGCGPGLYCKYFAQLGFHVTGLDYSKNSIEYAVRDAARNSLDIQYKYMNYLDMEYLEEFDAVLLIYGDFCVLADSDRDALLRKIYNALKLDGYFIFDVTTRLHREKGGLKNNWYMADSGFWKPGPHLVFEQGFDYPEESTYLDQYLVIEESGKISVYRNWFHDYSWETITKVMENNDFTVCEAWSDLTGTPYQEKSEWIGIVTRKK